MLRSSCRSACQSHLLPGTRQPGHGEYAEKFPALDAPPQVRRVRRLAWILGLAPNVLLIPGTSSVRHLDENLAAAGITLDEDARQQLPAAAAG